MLLWVFDVRQTWSPARIVAWNVFRRILATRRDGTSQGGYLQFAVTRSAAETGALVPLL